VFVQVLEPLGRVWTAAAVALLPLAQAAEGYRAMDERRAIKTLLTV